MRPASHPLVHILTFKLFPLVKREADDVKEQIEKKCQALNAADPGSDLFSVQALQRQHEGFERDLAPLGDKVRQELLSFSNIFFFTYQCLLLWFYFPFHILTFIFLLLRTRPCPCILSLKQVHWKDMPQTH